MHERWVKAEHSKGYRVLPPEEMSVEARNLVKQTERRLDKAAKCAGVVNLNKLSVHARQLHVITLRQLYEVKGMMDEQKSERRAYLTRKETHPRLERPE